MVSKSLPKFSTLDLVFDVLKPFFLELDFLLVESLHIRTLHQIKIQRTKETIV